MLSYAQFDKGAIVKVFCLLIGLILSSKFVIASGNVDYVAVTPEKAKFYSKKVKEYINLLEHIDPNFKFINYDIDKDYCLLQATEFYNTGSLKFCYELLKSVVDKRKDLGLL